jgi:hypothetical protein
MVNNFSIDFKATDDQTKLVVLGVDWKVLNVVKSVFAGKIDVNRFHIVIFEEEDEVYVNEANLNDFLDDVSISSILKFITTNQSKELVINKIGFTIESVDVLFDDDAMLFVSGKKTNKILELLGSIIAHLQFNSDH